MADETRSNDDLRATVEELAQRAQTISQEAGALVAAAITDIIGAGAGLTGFAVESARDLVEYMVRRGQLPPHEGERIISELESRSKPSED